jgi:pimeloyl-ACP methyl ester carboxylesterase
MSDSAFFEETSRTAKVGSLSLHYHEAGEGPPLVLLHGGGPGASARSNFKQNLPGLSRHFRVLLVDQPGYGGSDPPDGEGDYWTFAAGAVRDLLDELGIGRAHLLGNSLGGGTTVRFALDHADRAERLILMGPAGVALPILTPSPSEGLKLMMGFYAGDGPSREKMERFVRIMVFDQDLVTDALIEERYRAAMEPAAQKAAARILGGIGRSEASELWRLVGDVHHPTLLTWGCDDRILTLDGALFALNRMPDARLHVWPRCGHWAQLEHPAEFERQTIDFLTDDTKE